MSDSDFVEVPLPTDVQCSICLEVMHRAFALLPCLHKLCEECSKKIRNCPCCRADVTSTRLDHSFNSMVLILVQNRRFACVHCNSSVSDSERKNHRCAVDDDSEIGRLEGKFTALANHHGLPTSMLRPIIAEMLRNVTTGMSFDESVANKIFHCAQDCHNEAHEAQARKDAERVLVPPPILVPSVAQDLLHDTSVDSMMNSHWICANNDCRNCDWIPDALKFCHDCKCWNCPECDASNDFDDIRCTGPDCTFADDFDDWTCNKCDTDNVGGFDENGKAQSCEKCRSWNCDFCDTSNYASRKKCRSCCLQDRWSN